MCNAEQFVTRAKALGLTVGQTPRLGAIAVWQAGATLQGTDGAGHVAIVEKMVSDTEIVTSESGWKAAKPFWTQTRKKGTGNWGQGSSYKFLGFIYNPAACCQGITGDRADGDLAETMAGYMSFGDKFISQGRFKLFCIQEEDAESYDGRSVEASEFILFTGPIDAFYGYQFGELKYRSLRFETEELHTENYQGNAVVNYTNADVPFTRIIEHKHFEFGQQPTTIITREYPVEWEHGMEPYYPVNDEENAALYAKYEALAQQEKNVIFGGRLGSYRYYDMDQVIAAALDTVEKEAGA